LMGHYFKANGVTYTEAPSVYLSNNLAKR
jgi:hypothetical protein